MCHSFAAYIKISNSIVVCSFLRTSVRVIILQLRFYILQGNDGYKPIEQLYKTLLMMWYELTIYDLNFNIMAYFQINPHSLTVCSISSLQIIIRISTVIICGLYGCVHVPNKRKEIFCLLLCPNWQWGSPSLLIDE